MRPLPAPAPSLRRRVTAVALGALVAGGLAVSAAHADPGRSISGTVTGPDGEPVADVAVVPYVYNVEFDSWDAVDQGETTAADGTYELTGLGSTSYLVEFVPETGLTGEFWDDAPTVDEATEVLLEEQATVTGVDAQLSSRSVLAGTVTGTTGAPLPGIAVTLYTSVAWETWTQADFTLSDDDGGYAFADLLPGTYRVGFTDDEGVLATEYFDDVSELAVADDIDVGAGETVGGIDAVLSSEAGTIRNIDPPVIWEDAVVGQQLTVDLGRWSKSEFTASYQWLADGTPISGATGATYTPKSADVGKQIAVRVTASSPGWQSGVATSDPTEPVTSQPTLPSADPPEISGEIDGKAYVGETLTTTPGTWTPAATSVRYQWLRDGVPIPGATTNTYQLQPADAGAEVGPVTYGSRAGYREGRNDSFWTGPVIQRVVKAGTTPPTISGAVAGVPLVGRPLTATTGTWTPTGLTYSYEWLAGGQVVASGPSATYTPQAADRGKTLAVRVTASRLHHTPATHTSAATAPVDLPTVTAGVPSVEGVAIVGGVLTAEPGTWQQGASLTYQWLDDGVPVAGATGSTFPLEEDDLGRELAVRVTGSLTDHHDGVAVSPTREPVSADAVTVDTLPAVTGETRVGVPVSADPGTWTPAEDLTFAYQWFAGGTEIPGADDATYTPVAADVAKALTVKVTAARSGYASGTATSAPSAAVQPALLVATAAPTTRGTPQVGQRLTATPGTWDGDPTGFAYQWLVNGAPVAGQTASSFVVPPAALGKSVAVRVTASGPGQTPVSADSAATPRVKPGLMRVTKAPTVKGTAKVGKALRATPGAVSPAATKVTYQWLRNGRAIPRATKASYKLTRTDRGKKVSVRVTYVRTGYTTLQKASRPTGKVK